MGSLIVRPPEPYSLGRTIASFKRFPDELVDVAHDGCYRRLINVDGELVLTEARSRSIANVEISVLNAAEVSDAGAVAGIETVRRILSLDEEINAVADTIRNTRKIAILESELRGLRRTIDPSPFEGLVSSILAQLISIRGAATVRARLVRRFGQSLDFDGRQWWAFPDAAAVAASSVDELAGQIRMTSAKAKSILAVARADIAGELDLQQLNSDSDQNVIRHLTALPGIGNWTAEWFLVNVMGRMAIVPSGDLGIRRSTGEWFFDGQMPSAAAVQAHYAPFGEQRAYVAYYVLSAERLKLRTGTASNSD